MPLNPKAKRRITIVLIAALVLMVGASGAYVWRKRQLNARLVASRDEGYARLAVGDYFHAMHKIGPYLLKHPKDTEALMKYGTARAEVEEQGGRNIIDAIGIFRQLLAIEPEHAAARKQLLKLYELAYFNSETLAATEKPEDDDSRRARVIALARTNRVGEALRLAVEYLERNPTDLAVQRQLLALQLQDGTKPEELVERITKLHQSNPKEPRFEILLADAHSQAKDTETALRWARSAAEHTLNDPELLQVSVEQLDNLGDHDAAFALMERAAGVKGDAGFQRLVVARLYQSSQFQQVIDRTAAAEAEAEAERADVEMLGHRAMAFAAMKKSDDYRRVLAILSARKDDFAAVAWSRVLSAIPPIAASSDDPTIIAACRDGLKSLPRNAYFHVYLGDAYAHVGEAEAARNEWTAAAMYARAWPAPYSRVLKSTLRSGQSVDALPLASALEHLAPRDPDALGLVAVARARFAPQMSDAQRAETLQFAQRVQDLKPGEEASLAAKLVLLDAMGKPDEARKTLEAALGSTPPPPQSALLTLASASQLINLGMEQACFNLCLQAHGQSTTLAWTQASVLAKAGKSQEAIRAFESARASAGDKDSVDWQLAWTAVLDEAGDTRASKLLADLADANPQNLVIQERVLSAKSVQENRDLMRRAIDRLQAVLGEAGINWRLADAQWTIQSALLENNETERQKGFAKAASTLNDLVRADPQLLPARLMLADCLNQLRDPHGAAEQLSAAVRLSPDSIQPVLQLASLLQANKDFEKAKPYLEQAERILKGRTLSATSNEPAQPVVASAQLPPVSSREQRNVEELTAAWRSLASLYLARGDSEHALAILHQLERDLPATRQPTDVARILANRGELNADARRELLSKPTLESIEIVASSYARQRKADDVENTLKLLEPIEAKPGEKDLVRLSVYQKLGNTKKAIECAALAAKAMPENAGVRRSLIGLMLLDGQGKDAVAAARDAQVKFATMPVFAQVTSQQELVLALSDAAIARPLLAALIDESQDVATITAALQIVRSARASDKRIDAVASELRPLADRAISATALQFLLIDLYQRMAAFDDAAAVASRLMQVSPNDPNPAARACESLAAAGRWTDVLPVAEQWRRRLGASPLAADTMIAMAHIATGNPDAARKQLDPHLSDAVRDPITNANVLDLYARALIASGRTGDARALLEPTLSSGPPLRYVWVRIAVQLITEADAAKQWLNMVDPLITATPSEERFGLAAARVQLAERSDSPATRIDADTAVRKLTDAMKESATKDDKLWLALGVLQEMRGDDAAAELSYLRCIELGSKDPIVSNNLAMVIVRRNGDLVEAMRLAEVATKDTENPNRHEFLDTLAQIQSRAGQNDAAATSIVEAIHLQPKNTSFRARLIEIFVAAGKSAEAQKALAELESVVAAQRQPDAALVAKLNSLRASVRSASESDAQKK